MLNNRTKGGQYLHCFRTSSIFFPILLKLRRTEEVYSPTLEIVYTSILYPSKTAEEWFKVKKKHTPLNSKVIRKTNSMLRASIYQLEKACLTYDNVDNI